MALTSCSDHDIYLVGTIAPSQLEEAHVNRFVDYDQIRCHLAELVYLTAFPLTPNEPSAPFALFEQLQPILERCTLWELTLRLHILEPADSLEHRIALWEIIKGADKYIHQARQTAPGKVKKMPPMSDEEARRLDAELEAEYGSPASYSPDSMVLRMKAQSLLETLTREVHLNPEAEDVQRKASNGMNLVTFWKQYFTAQYTKSYDRVDWDKLIAAASSFDQQVVDELTR